MDLADLEQRLIVLEDQLLAHPDVVRQLPRPSLTFMKVLSAGITAISIFLLIAGTLTTPYAALILGVAAVLAPLEKLLDIYLTNTAAKAAAVRTTAAATFIAVRHAATLASQPVLPAAVERPMPPRPPSP